jgi:hypothetical protein
MIIINFNGRFSSAAKYISENTSSIFPGSFLRPVTLLIRTSSIFSNIKIFFILLALVATGRKEVFAPRSNSRSLLLLLWPFANHIKLFLYSDGIGDEVNSCRLERFKNYSGFIGYDISLMEDNYFHKIPKKNILEDWADEITYAENGALLLIAKYPKEIPYPKSLVIKLYSLELNKYRSGISLLGSGDNEIIGELSKSFNIINIGPLTSLKKTLNIKLCLGLPSTAFITFLAKLPSANVQILDLLSHSEFEDAVVRNNRMKKIIKKWSCNS